MLRSTDPLVGSDAVTRANTIAHEYTLHEWYPVANATARAQHVTDLGAAGVAISASNPARVYRADAPVGSEHEISEDGSTWYSVETPVFTTAGARVAQPRIVRYEGTISTDGSGDLTWNLSTVLSAVYGVSIVYVGGPKYLVPCVVDNNIASYRLRIWDAQVPGVLVSKALTVRVIFFGAA